MMRKRNIFPQRSIILIVLISIGIFGINALFTSCQPIGVGLKKSRDAALLKLNTGVIEIEYGNELTNKPKVHLALQNPSAVEMYLTHDPYCKKGGAWEPYRQSRIWDFDLGEENKETFIYVLFKDQKGHISKCVGDSIIHDNTPPTISFVDVNAVRTNQQATIKFVVTDNLSDVKNQTCTLDSIPISCDESQFSFENSTGGHSADVLAIDKAGNRSQIYSLTWTSDFDKPTVGITSTPSNPSGTSNLVFSFNGSDVHSVVKSYKCSVDSSIEKDCSSPFVISSLEEGTHTFSVIAIDESNNRSLPAEYTWFVDSANLNISITHGPDLVTNSNRATFRFQGFDGQSPLAVFECRLDNGSYSSCSNGQSYDNLASGDHTFYLRAQDSAGKTSTPTSYSWKIDTLAPIIAFSQTPASLTKESTANFVWTVSEDFGNRLYGMFV